MINLSYEYTILFAILNASIIFTICSMKWTQVNLLFLF